ncbi:RNA-binding ATPase activator esf2 [Coemansia interrupta]|uniref:18S rRNA factor 2 n=1 Tax=Coemansia interrupta TaxID=1126814 RepID=A0A9W8LJE2_9FUNG|nr:RNA-binding ATPase activator esf2 [Coemansia interrupta]
MAASGSRPETGSGNEDEDSDEEEEEEEAGRSAMIRKRPAYNDGSSDDSASDDSEQDDGADNIDGDDGSDEEDFFVGDMGNSGDEADSKNSKGKRVSEKEILQAQKREKKSGVVYMSRVPPFMKPAKVRHLLEKYGEIGRIYLVEEDDKRRKRRVKSGGNRRKQFVEGWIEFKNKKYAKAVAGMLNNTQFGGKKHGFYHDDLWNLKYLPKFKWRHLTEQLASERASREQKLQSEVSQSRKELDEYVRNVERAKMLEGMRAKREKRAQKEGVEMPETREVSRNVWQRDVVVRSVDGAGKKGVAKAAQSADDAQGDSKRRKTMASVLDQIF